MEGAVWDDLLLTPGLVSCLFSWVVGAGWDPRACCRELAAPACAVGSLGPRETWCLPIPSALGSFVFFLK